MLKYLVECKKPLESYYEGLIPYVIKNVKASEERITKGSRFYRARVFSDIKKAFNNDIFEGFNEKDSLAPKPKKVKESGRLNQKNESVLYIAEDDYTSLAECKVRKKQKISIAEVELLNEVNVVTFKFNEAGMNADSVKQIYQSIALEFYITVYNEKDYLITQYVGKKIKELGYGGVKYSSSLSAQGMNIALFDTEIAKANSSKVYLTQSVLFYAERMKEDNCNRLIPKSITDKFTDDEIEYFFNRMK